MAAIRYQAGESCSQGRPRDGSRMLSPAMRRVGALTHRLRKQRAHKIQTASQFPDPDKRSTTMQTTSNTFPAGSSASGPNGSEGTINKAAASAHGAVDKAVAAADEAVRRAKP